MKWNKNLYPIILMSLFGCGIQPQVSEIDEAPNASNNPNLMGVTPKKLKEIRNSATLKEAPWSGSYWPTYQGGLSHRWQMNQSSNNYKDYLYETFSASDLESLPKNTLDLLSPSEKYDMWLGHTSFPLTLHEQSRTKSVVRDGAVETWFGLCHGWAPAAFLEPQAKQSVTVKTPVGRDVTFFASDIKALVTKVYADASLSSRFIGGRCYDNEIMRDASGRAIDSKCRDTNPATFHLVLEDYIGRQNKSFIMDVTASGEVWNQPVYSYQFQYSNRRSYSPDSYSNAAQGTAELVDVFAKVKYMVETQQSRSAVRSQVKQMNLSYTLELNKDGYIIGGEWLGSEYPDFLWAPTIKPENFATSILSYKKVKELLTYSTSDEPQPPQIVDPEPPRIVDPQPSRVIEQRIKCESIDYKAKACRVRGKIVSIRLEEQLSSSKCKKGSTWKSADNSVMVFKGCRAIFLIDVEL